MGNPRDHYTKRNNPDTKLQKIALFFLKNAWSSQIHRSNYCQVEGRYGEDVS